MADPANLEPHQLAGSMYDAQAQAWGVAGTGVPYNPDAAIAKRWLAEKAKGNLIGVPIGSEIVHGADDVSQSFTSGAVIHWLGGADTEIV